MIAFIEKEQSRDDNGTERDYYIITLFNEEDRTVVDKIKVNKVWIDVSVGTENLLK